MASNWSVCGICDSLNQTKSSVVWCSECEEGLCSDCNQRHGVSKATRNHQTLSIEKYSQLPENVLQATQTCPDHHKTYQTYCCQHDCLCCIECDLKAHRGCQNVQNIAELEGTLANVTENVKKIIKDRESNAASLKEQKRKIENNIKAMRDKINIHLDKVERQLLQELDNLEKQENGKISTLLSEMKIKEKRMKDMESEFISIKEHASNLQIFLAMKNIENDCKKEDECINTLFTGPSLDELSLSFSSEMSDFEQMNPSFGKIYLKRTSHRMKKLGKKDKQAQIRVSKPLVPVEKISLTLFKKIRVNAADRWGCTFLDNGRYAISSYDSKCVIVMKQDGSKDFRIDTKPYKIIDIAYIPSIGSIAATIGFGEHRINIIDISKRIISHSIQVNTNIYGITLHGDKLVYCAQGKGLQVMNMSNNNIHTKEIKTLSAFAYVASFRDNLYYTDKYNNTVTCCDTNGQTRWQFKDKVLNNPCGVCLDGDGYVYVVGNWSDNVIVISSDGLHHTVLLTSKNDLSLPTAIDYDRNNNVLLVTNHDRDAFIYHVRK